jgi:hypothetical protein
MLQGFRGVPFLVMVAWNLVSGHAVAGGQTAPQPETEQVVSTELKKLYMAVAAATPHSAAQQEVIRQMAATASNGKELLLTMRAGIGVFPAAKGSQENPAESRIRAIATAKMMQAGTVEQLIEFATQYSVSADSARPFVQRMMQLGSQNSDPRIWHRIRLVASRLRVPDLEKEALAKAEELTSK